MAELDGEALFVAILPGAAAIDEKRLYADPGEQLLHCGCRKLRTVVRADVARRLAIGERNGQKLQDIIRPQTPSAMWQIGRLADWQPTPAECSADRKILGIRAMSPADLIGNEYVKKAYLGG